MTKGAGNTARSAPGPEPENAGRLYSVSYEAYGEVHTEQVRATTMQGAFDAVLGGHPERKLYGGSIADLSEEEATDLYESLCELVGRKPRP